MHADMVCKAARVTSPHILYEKSTASLSLSIFRRNPRCKWYMGYGGICGNYGASKDYKDYYNHKIIIMLSS